MKYAFIEANRSQFSVALMARTLGVSRSGFHAWSQRISNSRRHDARESLDQSVRTVFYAHKSRYGAPRVAKELHEMGTPCDRKTVASSLRRQGLRARAARKYKATTNSEHSLPVAPNVLKQDFSASAPNQKWVSDITYLPTDEGWLYLATVIDLYSRQVIGWAMDKRMHARLVCDALEMALWRRKRPAGVIVHSDRGSQYCSGAYQRLIARYELRCSMSRRADCYDNSCAETFFHTLKVELTHGVRYASREQLRAEVLEYIETYYNTIRRHSTIGYISPAAFEQLEVA